MKEGVMWIFDIMDVVVFIMVIIVETVFSAMMSRVEMTKSMVIMHVMSRTVIKAMMRDLMAEGMI